MAFDKAHDFNIGTANMGTTHNHTGTLMFWNNKYETGAIHNQAVVHGSGTFNMGGQSSASSPASPPTPSPAAYEREYSGDGRYPHNQSSSWGQPQSQPQYTPPQSQGSHAPSPQQSPYHPSPEHQQRQQSDYSGYMSSRAPSWGPATPQSRPSYQPQYSHGSAEGRSQTNQQAGAWAKPTQASRAPSSQPYAQPSPHAQHGGASYSGENSGASARGASTPASGAGMVSRDSSRSSEAPLPPPQEIRPPAALSTSASTHSAEDQDHAVRKKKRGSWQRLKFWSPKKNEKAEKR